MNKDQLTQGKTLDDKIQSIKTQIGYWENASRISSILLYVNGYNTAQNPNLDYVNFEVLKTLTIASLNKELALLEEQFNKL